MSKARRLLPDVERRTGRLIGAAVEGLALLGGLVLIALVLLTAFSIAGRSLIAFGFRPLAGDFELVEMGTAFAIFAFLPWCQYRRGHVSVDILSARFGLRIQAALATLGNLLMTIVAAIITWRLYLGTTEKFRYGETTFILQLTVGWGYALCLIGAALFCLTAAYTVWRSLNEALSEGEGEPADLAFCMKHEP